MASMGWEKVGKRWRVFWHVTMSDGNVRNPKVIFAETKVGFTHVNMHQKIHK